MYPQHQLLAPLLGGYRGLLLPHFASQQSPSTPCLGGLLTACLCREASLPWKTGSSESAFQGRATSRRRRRSVLRRQPGLSAGSSAAAQELPHQHCSQRLSVTPQPRGALLSLHTWNCALALAVSKDLGFASKFPIHLALAGAVPRQQWWRHLVSLRLCSVLWDLLCCGRWCCAITYPRRVPWGHSVLPQAPPAAGQTQPMEEEPFTPHGLVGLCLC